MLENPLLLSVVSEFTSTLRLDATCAGIKEARREVAHFRLEETWKGDFLLTADLRASILRRVKRPRNLTMTVHVEDIRVLSESKLALLSEVCVILRVHELSEEGGVPMPLLTRLWLNVTQLHVCESSFDAESLLQLADITPNSQSCGSPQHTAWV